MQGYIRDMFELRRDRIANLTFPVSSGRRVIPSPKISLNLNGELLGTSLEALGVLGVFGCVWRRCNINTNTLEFIT